MSSATESAVAAAGLQSLPTPPPSLSTESIGVVASYPATPSSSESAGDAKVPPVSPRGRNSHQERRKRLLEHRKSRLDRMKQNYKDSSAELYYLSTNNGVVASDLATFKRKLPSLEFLEYLRSEVKVPKLIAQMLDSSAGVPSSSVVAVELPETPSSETLLVDVKEEPEATPSSSFPPAESRLMTRLQGQITSAHMAAAVAAYCKTKGTLPSSTASESNFSVKASSLLSPVKYGRQLRPFPLPLNHVAQNQRRHLAYPREQLQEKIRHEPFVLRRVAELTKDGLWTDKRLPKVCERPTPKTHWDGLLQEMNWLAVDFHQERKWKKAAAKMLAESARDFVKEWEVRRKAKREAVERHKRRLAKAIADEILKFWQAIELSCLSYKGRQKDYQLTNDDDDWEEIDYDELAVEKYSEDESTIEEQENYEAEHTLVDHRLELDTLTSDNRMSLDQVLQMNYPNYVRGKTEEEDESSGISCSSAESSGTDDDYDSEEDDEEEFNLESNERLINLQLSGKQRRLYDDYMAGPDVTTAVEDGDAGTISSVLSTLRKICNHPDLVDGDEGVINFPMSFSRIPDLYDLPHIKSKFVARTMEYDPFKDIDLRSLNMVYFSHEFSLTAITSDRIRKCCAPKTLLLDSKGSKKNLKPLVPSARFKLEIQPATGGGSMTPLTPGGRQLVQTVNGQHMFLYSSPLSPKEKEQSISTSKDVSNSDSGSFHEDSLLVIARFNERRCQGMPLYGKDLVDALTVVSDVIPRTRRPGNRFSSGQGYVQCLNAIAARGLLTATRSLDEMVNSVNIIHSDNSPNLKFGRKIILVEGHSHVLDHRQKNWILPAVKNLSRVLGFGSDGIRVGRDETLLHTNFPDSISMRKTSSKLDELDKLLRSIRSAGERCLVFCEMPEMLEMLKSFLHRHRFQFSYLDGGEKSLSVTRTTVAILAPTSVPPPSDHILPRIANVVFFDSNWNNFLGRPRPANGFNNLHRRQKSTPCVQWCGLLNKNLGQESSLTVYRLICQNTVEDSISRKTLQRKLLGDLKIIPPDSSTAVTTVTDRNGSSRVGKIRRQTLEDLFFNSFKPGDNGIFSNDLPGEKDPVEVLNDVEAIAQLDWLWSSKFPSTSSSAATGPSSTTTGCETNINEEEENDESVEKVFRQHERRSSNSDYSKASKFHRGLTPIQKYAFNTLKRFQEEGDEEFLDDELGVAASEADFGVTEFCLKLDQEKRQKQNEEDWEWELGYQSQIRELELEIERLEHLRLITYSSENGARMDRMWHAEDGRPMPIWSGPSLPNALGYHNIEDLDLAPDYLSLIYQVSNTIDEADLPPVYAGLCQKNVGNKRTAREAGFNGSEIMDNITPLSKKQRNAFDDSGASGAMGGGTYAPRSLFDRPPNIQKRPKRPVVGGGQAAQSLGARMGANLPTSVAGLKYPLPRPQVEAENSPEWYVAEDWALLRAIREILELPLNLHVTSPAHTPNWDMIADMVNSVSHVYRGPRQCRNRYETIVLPREEGRLIYDVSVVATSLQPSTKNKKKKLPGSIPGQGPSKPTKPVKTSTLFKQDNNSTWSQTFVTKFSNVKAAAGNHPPVTKPLVVNNPVPRNPKHTQHLAESGINYETPLSPISVAANRAERIHRERNQQDQQRQQLNQHRAQAAAIAVQQQIAGGAVSSSSSPNVVQAALSSPHQHVMGTTAATQRAQNQAAVVVGISQNSSTPQQVIQSTAITQHAPAVVEHVRVAGHQQQPTVVVSSHQPGSVVTVANITGHIGQRIVQTAGGVAATSKQSVAVPTVAAAAGQQRSFVGNVVLGTKQQQQLSLIQQSAMRKTTQEVAKARLQTLQPTSIPPGSVSNPTVSVAGGRGTVQTVSLAAAASGGVPSISSTTAMSGAVTVVTQASAGAAIGGQPKAHLIRQVTPSGSKVRAVNDSEMKLILAKQPQQIQHQQATKTVQIQQGAQASNIAQLLAQGGIQLQSGAGGTQVATIVKTAGAGGAAAAQVNPQGGQQQQSVTIPVNASMNLPQVRAALQRTSPGMQYIQRQILQRNTGVTGAFTTKQPAAAALVNQQKIQLAQAGKVPAQLIVSSGAANTVPISSTGQKPGQLPSGVTVQQFQQIVKSVQQQQGSVPHTVLAAKQQTPGGTAVQARVIPVSSGSNVATPGRTQQIQVVATAPGQAVAAAVAAARQAAGSAGSAPNVTVDASGRPTGTGAVATTNSQIANALASQIRIQGQPQQQIINQVSAALVSGQPVSVAVRGTTAAAVLAAQQQNQATKLQVVNAQQSTSGQGSSSSDQSKS